MEQNELGQQAPHLASRGPGCHSRSYVSNVTTDSVVVPTRSRGIGEGGVTEETERLKFLGEEGTVKAAPLAVTGSGATCLELVLVVIFSTSDIP